MKIVISPAKSLDFSIEIPFKGHTIPYFQQEMQEINAVLKEKSPSELVSLMGISEKLAELNWARNQEFSLPFTWENARPAVYTFSGDVYEGLQVYSFTETQMEKLQASLRILSGQYGILKPLDLIQAYRLEMGTHIAIGKCKDLYAYWREKITDFLNAELTQDELFINLASNEYFSVVDTKKLKVKVITPVFKDWKGDSLKVVSFYAKRARGLMVKYIIENDIQSLEDLKGFHSEGYSFQESLSKSPEELVFVR